MAAELSDAQLTVGALLVCEYAEVLLVEHLVYGIALQPGGNHEPIGPNLPRRQHGYLPSVEVFNA